MKVQDILRGKGSRVITVAPELPVREALRVLTSYDIGALVVFADGIQGLVTERHLLRRAAEAPERFSSARVHDVMTIDVVTATPGAEVCDVMDLMIERRVRYLPVLDGDRLCGIVSMSDVIDVLRRGASADDRAKPFADGLIL